MSELIEAHIAQLRAEGYRSVAQRRRLLQAADRQLRQGIERATTAELVVFLSNDDWSEQTRHTYHAHLAGFYQWASAGQHPRLDWNPLADIKAPPVPERLPNPVTDEQVDHAYQQSNGRWRTIVALAAYAGLRASEISNMTRENVTRKHVRVVQGKGLKDGFVPTHELVWQLVEPMPPGLLFPSRATGGPLSKDSMSKMARRHFITIGMDGVHLHRFRHWFGTSLAEAGVDVFTIRTLMRHKSLTSTQLYVLVAQRMRRSAIAALPALGGSLCSIGASSNGTATSGIGSFSVPVPRSSSALSPAQGSPSRRMVRRPRRTVRSRP